MNRTARFWIEGDLRGWDFAAKQSRRAFNGAIHAYDLGKGMTIAGQFAREWAPWLHSQITGAVATLVARPTWRSYLARKRAGQKASVPQVNARSVLAMTYTAWREFDVENLTLRFSMWSPAFEGYQGPQVHRLYPFEEGWDDVMLHGGLDAPKSLRIHWHRRKRLWHVNVPTKQEPAAARLPLIVAGIDVGFRKHFAVISAPEIRAHTFFAWGATRDRDRRDAKTRHRLQKMGKKRALRTRRDKTARYREDHIRKIVAEIVRWCIEQGVGLVRAEDLKGIRARGQEWRRETKRELNSWPYLKFQRQLCEKLLEHGIEMELVEAAYTSQRCWRCGHTERANRRGGYFRCRRCGHENNAELNAANNIAEAPGKGVVIRDLEAA